jgi:hypothetical protein
VTQAVTPEQLAAFQQWQAQQAAASQFQQAPAQAVAYPLAAPPQAPAPVAAPAVAPGFTPPPTFAMATGGGGMKPGVRQLGGRHVIMIQTSDVRLVKKYEAKDGETEEEITVDVVVLDGGPLTFGDKVKGGVTPPTHVVQTPCRINNVPINKKVLIKSLAEQGGRGAMVIGFMRGVQGTQNFYYELAPPVDQAAIGGMATAWWTATDGGKLNNPEPQLTAYGQQVDANRKAAEQASAALAQAAQQHARPAAQAYQAAPAAAAPQGWNAGGFPTPQAAPAAAPAGWPQAPAQVAPATPTLSQGIPANLWESMSPEQQQAFMAHVQASAGAPAGI